MMSYLCGARWSLLIALTILCAVCGCSRDTSDGYGGEGGSQAADEDDGTRLAVMRDTTKGGTWTVEARLVSLQRSQEEGLASGPEWKNFVGIAEYEIVEPLASGGEKGTVINVIIPRDDVTKEGFTTRKGDVRAFDVGAVHRITVTSKLPEGWDDVAWEFGLGIAQFRACLVADGVRVESSAAQ